MPLQKERHLQNLLFNYLDAAADVSVAGAAS